MMSGLQEAVRIVDILENRGDTIGEAEALAAAQRQSGSERNEVRDMVTRLAAGELSNVLRGDTVLGEGEQGPLGRADLVKDMKAGLLVCNRVTDRPGSSMNEEEEGEVVSVCERGTDRSSSSIHHPRTKDGLPV
ncbi:unnamed protein product [Sphagnum jensenii]|uniref:Uncharacterized protein n=1 Tax=Sphagnum jensenii TaxID=128206 RepID=A0ABP1A0K2_9BRYO